MYYRDEFGFEMNLPQRPNESAIEAVRNSRDTLITCLYLLEKRSTGKNTCTNPIVKKDGEY